MKTRRQSHQKVLAMFGAIYLIIVLQAATALAAGTVAVFPRDSTPYGRSYGEWAAAWNQWSYSIPVSNHPLFDNGDVSVGQSGPVWFLGGKFCSNFVPTCAPGVAERTVTIPAGKALFFPIMDSEDSMIEDPRNDGLINGLRQYNANNIDPVTNNHVSLELDGVSLTNLVKDFRVTSPAFGFMIPADNLLNAIYAKKNLGNFAAGSYFPAVDDGIYIMLKPLPPGKHTLHFRGTFPQFEFTIDITYYITQL